jgi:hypothetical protein
MINAPCCCEQPGVILRSKCERSAWVRDFPDVSRSCFDASGITDCWEAGNLSQSFREPPFSAVIQEKWLHYSDCRRSANFCLTQRAARSNSLAGGTLLTSFRSRIWAPSPPPKIMQTSSSAAISRLSFGVGDRSCEVLCLSATASSRVIPELIVPFAINSSSRCFGRICVSSQSVRGDGGKSCQ